MFYALKSTTLWLIKKPTLSADQQPSSWALVKLGSSTNEPCQISLISAQTRFNLKGVDNGIFARTCATWVSPLCLRPGAGRKLCSIFTEFLLVISGVTICEYIVLGVLRISERASCLELMCLVPSYYVSFCFFSGRNSHSNNCNVFVKKNKNKNKVVSPFKTGWRDVTCSFCQLTTIVLHFKLMFILFYLICFALNHPWELVFVSL